MKEITEMGFLRIESGSYIAVPGMKISKAEDDREDDNRILMTCENAWRPTECQCRVW